MSTVVKDLGAATAYGYAVEKGYTGTEAEFAELMASYATVGQTAVTAAQTATTKASEAATSATTATNKASEATTAATTATTKAAEAQADADAAALDASQALSAASTATTKATEATTAAATATSAATTATTAKDDAVSAKTAAQTAQAGAETAAASVSASAAQIAQNTSDISELKEVLYSEITLSFTDDKFINNNGTVYDSNLWALSDLISVAPYTTVEITTDIQSTSAICVLNSDGALVKSVQGTSGVKPYVVTIPDGGAYIRFSCYKANKSKSKIRPLYVADSLTSFINDNGSTINRSPKENEIIDGYLITKTGSVAASAQWEVTDFIPVFPESTLMLHAYTYGSGAVVIYDKDKNVILGIDGNNASDYGGSNTYSVLQNYTLQDMQDARFVRFSAWKEYKRVSGSFVAYSAPWKDHVEELLVDSNDTYADKKILVIGDSISSDAYGSYKKWVTNLIEEGKFKQTNVTNSSQHATGFVARYSSQTPDDFITRVEAIADKSTYDLVVVFGGINDFIQNVPLGGESGETDKTMYFKPAVDYFFNYLVNNFTQARICVLLPLRNYNVYPNTAGNKQEVYSQYIHDVAKSYCLPVLNLTEESGFCPFIDSFKQMWTLIPSGYTAPDGTHPNADYEKKYLAPMIWKFISGLLH